MTSLHKHFGIKISADTRIDNWTLAPHLLSSYHKSINSYYYTITSYYLQLHPAHDEHICRLRFLCRAFSRRDERALHWHVWQAASPYLILRTTRLKTREALTTSHITCEQQQARLAEYIQKYRYNWLTLMTSLWLIGINLLNFPRTSNELLLI